MIIFLMNLVGQLAIYISFAKCEGVNQAGFLITAYSAVSENKLTIKMTLIFI